MRLNNQYSSHNSALEPLPYPQTITDSSSSHKENNSKPVITSLLNHSGLIKEKCRNRFSACSNQLSHAVWISNFNFSTTGQVIQEISLPEISPINGMNDHEHWQYRFYQGHEGPLFIRTRDQRRLYRLDSNSTKLQEFNSGIRADHIAVSPTGIACYADSTTHWGQPIPSTIAIFNPENNKVKTYPFKGHIHSISSLGNKGFLITTSKDSETSNYQVQYCSVRGQLKELFNYTAQAVQLPTVLNNSMFAMVDNVWDGPCSYHPELRVFDLHGSQLFSQQLKGNRITNPMIDNQNRISICAFDGSNKATATFYQFSTKGELLLHKEVVNDDSFCGVVSDNLNARYITIQPIFKMVGQQQHATITAYNPVGEKLWSFESRNDLPQTITKPKYDFISSNINGELYIISDDHYNTVSCLDRWGKLRWQHHQSGAPFNYPQVTSSGDLYLTQKNKMLIME